jgi:predicted TPR repeat methyltransferase
MLQMTSYLLGQVFEGRMENLQDQGCGTFSLGSKLRKYKNEK